MAWVAIVAASLFLLNLGTMLCFWHDKQRAIEKRWRVPEARLLGLALIGGSPGAFAGRHLFRHKTRKQPFMTLLWLIAAGQAGAAIGLVFG